MENAFSSQLVRNFRKTLSELPLFADLAPDLLDEIAQGSCNVLYQKGQPVYRAGDPPTQLFVLASGQIKTSLTCRRGNERILELLEPGQVFGQAELFVAGPYVVSAFAVKPAHVLAIRRDTLFRAMESDSRIARRIIEMLARRQLETESDLIAQNSWSPGERLLGYLVELAGPDRPTTGETTVTLETSKKVLAARFDMQPETLSRNLRDLTEAGLIVVAKNRVTLRNTEIERHLLTHPDPRMLETESIHRVRRSPPRQIDESLEDGRDELSQFGWINGAGRQRALSQRMAKSWLMLEQGLLTRQSRLVLRQSVNLFDSRLKELEIQCAGTKNQAACSELVRLWPRYREILETSPNANAAHRLYTVAEDILGIADELTRGIAESEGTHKARLINLAGRGRMLSQRAARNFLFHRMGIKVDSCRSQLDEANSEFTATLDQLKASAANAPSFVARVESSGNLWRLFRSTIETGDSANFPAMARKVFRLSEDLLNRSDAMVDLCVDLPEDDDQPTRRENAA